MIVFSPLSLYTTYLGWQQFDMLFDAFWQTGILYIGFLALAYRFLKNVLAPTSSTPYVAEQALNQFLYELAVTFIICSLFIYPCVPLEQKGLSFKPLCTAQSGAFVKESTLHDTGTTYDEAFADVITNHVKIPLGFALLQNYVSSLTYGLIKVTGCTDSLQAIQGDLVSTYIPHDLRRQALQFHEQCFLEARNAYLKEEHSAGQKQQISSILKRYGGEDDLNWLGSKTFKTLYYSKLTAREPVQGFPFSHYPNSNFTKAAAEDKRIASHLPQDGYPTCNQWWDKIQSELVKTSEKAGYFDSHLGKIDITNRINAYRLKHKLTWYSDLTAQDYIAKVLLEDSRDLQIKSTESLIDPNQGIGNVLSRGLVNLGQSFKSVTSTPLKREATLQTLPVMHAFFYFFLIIFTPLVLALSGYSPRALGSLCGLFMMSIFLQYVWHLVGFVERSVLDPMGESYTVAAMRNMAVLFYYIAPVLLLKLSSHFGGDVGEGLSSMLGHADKTAQDSAESGAQVAKTGFRIITRR